MRFFKSSIIFRILFLVFELAASSRQISAQTAPNAARITQAIDETNLVTLRGNVHPLARVEFDQGPVADAQPLKRILLLLRRSPEQESALRQLLEDQQNKSSANYHAWMTPDQFGRQFGPADADIQAVTQWLAAHGFAGIKVGPGRNVIEFSGNVGQVRSAFHTEIHRYLVNGEKHQANVSDPQFPLALTPVVAGIVSLHDFRPVSHIRRVASFGKSKSGEVTPLWSPPGNSGQQFSLAPADFGKIYNVAPLWTAGITGTGQSIAVLGESDIKVQDIADFRTIFGLPQNFSSQNVFVNGVDPGLNGSEIESDLDIQWAGAIAPGATINFVTSSPTETTSGIHLSAVYAVDNNLAGIISVSFGSCEQHLGSTGNQFFNSLWQQAAAQGITVVVSSGDGGSAGCDNFDTQQTATQGLAVSGFASTPYNIAVGGTDFDQNNRWLQFWSFTNDPVTHADVLSYIPEIPWNDSCAQIGISGCGSSAPGGSLNIVAGSGGPSTLYSKPPWQSGAGVPSDGKRDLPDVSLFAGNGFTGTLYLICDTDEVQSFTGKCDLTSFEDTILGVGGTSASAPAFAGIMALVNQKQSSPAIPAPRQGVANYVLYALARTSGASCPSDTTEASTCIFNDVTHGNSDLPTGLAGIGTISVPCQGGTPNCSVSTAGSNGVLVSPASSTTEAWTVATGYDMATGLGSVNAQNFVNNWSSVTFQPSATTLTASVNGTAVSSISVAHGTPIGVGSSVAPGSGASGTPTGQVVLIATPNPMPGNPSASLGIEALALTNGSASSNSVILPGGSYSLTAHYQGDGTFGPSDSSPGLSVSITAENSKTLISIPVFDPTTGKETGNTPASIAYGSPYIGRFDVASSSASLTFPPQALCTSPNCPTGTVAVTDSLNGAAPTSLDAGSFSLNSSGFADDFAIQLLGGSHVLSATYSGDNSFNSSSGTYTVTVTPGATRIILSNPPLPFQVATPFNVGVILTMNFFGVMPSCNFTFLDGATAMQGTPNCAWQANGPFLYVNFPVSQTTSGPHTYSAKFNGDSNYASSTSALQSTKVFYGTTTTLSADSANVQYGASITLSALVDSTISSGPSVPNAVTFYYNNSPIQGTVSYTPTTDPSGNFALRASISFVPQFSSFAAALFNGDSNYFQSGSTTLNLNVNIPDFSLSASPLSSIPAGSSAPVTITVTPASNASSPVMLACPPPSLYGTPAGITCSFSPSPVNLSNGAAANSTLTISVLAPSASPTTSSAPFDVPAVRPRLIWPLPVTLLLTLLILCFVPIRSRRHRFAAAVALAGGLSLLLALVGCGGGSNGGGGGGGGPVPTSISLTASGVKVPYTSTSGGVVSLTANITSSKAVSGNVTFFVDGSAGFSVSSSIVSGVAQFQLTGLSVGVHTVTAQYSGDANNLSSQTKGSLNIAVTGQTGVSVQANTGGLFHTIGVNFTLQ